MNITPLPNITSRTAQARKGPHMTYTATTGARARPMHRTIRDRLRVNTIPNHAQDVHFHQGPQGQPAPCFDERCQNPRLSV
jgi:hypothetical protein